MPAVNSVAAPMPPQPVAGAQPAAAGGVDVAGALAQAGQLQAQIAALTGGAVPGAPAAPAAAAPASTNPAAAAANAMGGGVPPPSAGSQPVAASTMSGAVVTVTKTDRGYVMTPATGKLEVVNVDNKILRFNEAGLQTRSFELANKKVTSVALQGREGIATGIANLSILVAARQERLKELTEALTADANDTGSINQVDLQSLTQENQTNENITGLQKKIYDSVQNAIQAWLR